MCEFITLLITIVPWKMVEQWNSVLPGHLPTSPLFHPNQTSVFVQTNADGPAMRVSLGEEVHVSFCGGLN